GHFFNARDNTLLSSPGHFRAYGDPLRFTYARFVNCFCIRGHRPFNPSYPWLKEDEGTHVSNHVSRRAGALVVHRAPQDPRWIRGRDLSTGDGSASENSRCWLRDGRKPADAFGVW